ncbi:basic proline-rich protein-like [Onychomys torridus]|uniref:basic proline-rich protein-like n=1 Tax=Onychomys torridus TaxID=38674 RepID=UPI00167F4C68|nr:basic proline-rich protein-like [Onychomys torridus]
MKNPLAGSHQPEPPSSLSPNHRLPGGTPRDAPILRPELQAGAPGHREEPRSRARRRRLGGPADATCRESCLPRAARRRAGRGIGRRGAAGSKAPPGAGGPDTRGLSTLSLKGARNPRALERRAIWSETGPWRSGLPRVPAESRLSRPPGPKVAGESCPDSDKLPRHLPDKVSSTSSSSGAGPRRKEGGGEPSPAAFVLRDKRSHVPLPGGARQIPPPRPPSPRPAAAASSRPRDVCAGVPATLLRATEGSGGSGRGDVRGPSPWEPPQPRSPSSKLSLDGRMPARREAERLEIWKSFLSMKSGNPSGLKTLFSASR